MSVLHRTSSLHEVARLAATEGRFGYALKDFLDGFYAKPNPADLAEEPALLAGVLPDGARLDAYLGAVAEHLCSSHRWPVPAWAQVPSRFLERPWFGMSSHGGRMVLLEESPAAFRVRNLFVSENALSRA